MRSSLRRRSALAAAFVLATLIAPRPAAAVVYPHIVNLATVPGSQGNGTLFTGSVCWIGILGSGSCFPGYENNISQIAFKTFTIPPATNWLLQYRYRSDCQPDSDVTYVIVDASGLPPVLQTSGDHAFVSPPSQRHVVASYSGAVEGTDAVSLAAYAGTTICVEFHSTSNATISDVDCGYLSDDGIFEFDHVQVGPNTTTFDSGADGWTFGSVGPVVPPPPTGVPGTSVSGMIVLGLLLAGIAIVFLRGRIPRTT